LGGQTLVTSLSDIRNEGVRRLADDAIRFLESHSWCCGVTGGRLGFAIDGVLGVFRLSIAATQAGVDSELWVVTGDLPPAYLVVDDASDWQAALAGYVEEMGAWVAAALSGGPVHDLIPVNVAPTPEHARALQNRLDFIRREFIERSADELEGDV
jgi:hypothetical protein